VEREPLREPTSGPRKWTMKAGANWETNDGGPEDGIDRYHIPRGDIPQGFDLQWVAVSVFGQPLVQERGQFERKGWTPVHQTDFDSRFDGRFMPKGINGEINVGGQVLMARPLELSLKARAREQRAAQDQVRIKEQALYSGDLPISGADHPSARRFNSVNRSVERIQVPEDN
jgi:hypothetical protein